LLWYERYNERRAFAVIDIFPLVLDAVGVPLQEVELMARGFPDVPEQGGVIG